MKPIHLAALAFLAIGIWAGVTFGGSTTVSAWIHGGLAVFFSANLLLLSWVWWRAKAGSADALAMPPVVLLVAATLLSTLPRLLWPSNEASHLAGSMTSGVVLVFAAVVLIRNRRRLLELSKAG